ncbi:MAG: tripartite tricarboxylate transporter substrate binding protein [Burkholderiales bacterium]|jgi:putative tricarboxylic transport membrane protein|nr:tripartite tricarboxylate transporter substrate binding protein [Burkholderiales bacterium]
MKLRSSMVIAACAAALAAAPAWAQFKPTKPVEFIVHTGPGGGADVLARFIAQVVEKENLAPVRFQVNNKSGGGGLTAMAYVAEKKGDTHAIAVFTGNWLTNPLTRAEAKYTVKDMTPVARLVLEPALVAVKGDAPYKTLKDFIEAAKKAPGTMKQSGGSITSRDNVVRQLLMKESGSSWAYISFPGGGERIAALLGGHVNMMVVEPQEAGEHIKAGNMRVIAQVSDKRLAGFPNVPTIKEAGYDIPNVPQVRGIVMPAGVAPDVLAYYEDLFLRITKTATWRKYLEEQQFEDGYMKSAELTKFFDVYSDQMRGILKEAGAKVVR